MKVEKKYVCTEHPIMGKMFCREIVISQPKQIKTEAPKCGLLCGLWKWIAKQTVECGQRTGQEKPTF